VARDRDTDARLKALGWKVIRLWEHTTVDDAIKVVLSVTEPRTSNTPAHKIS
jgi:DNA mismatch endonuclease, patch repair protein